jgi:glycosyltransferase involved in cell wall biosynthesis
VKGFVTTGKAGGDGLKVGVPYSTGIDAAKKLVLQCDTVVTWGIGELHKILPRKRPRVVAVHHSDSSSGWGNDTILRQLSLIDEIVCVNQHTAEHLKDCGKPVHYIPNAIDPRRIQPSGNQSALRAHHGIPEDSKIVLFGHRLSEEKRPLLALDIAKHLPPDWTMVVAGDGPEAEKVRKAAHDRVRIVGAVDSLADWLAVSDCFLSLSTFEGFGLSIGEAMAAGVPTVSTPTGIASGLATTLPTNSALQEWAQAIVSAKVIVQPEVILERCSVQRMVDAWANVIRGIK